MLNRPAYAHALPADHISAAKRSQIKIFENNLKLTWQDISFAFAFGIAMGLPLSQESPIFLGELISFLICIGAVLFGRMGSAIRKVNLTIVVVCMPIMFLGYILSDMIAGPESSDMFKTWARVTFQFADILAIACILSKGLRRFDWLALGFAISTIAAGFLRPEGLIWKYDGAPQLDMIAAFAATRLNRPIGAALLVLVGVVNLILDCRSPAAAAVLAGAIYFVGSASRYVKNLGITQIIVICGLSLVLIRLSWALVDIKALERQHASSVGRLSEIKVVLGACLRSPLVGHGSGYVSSDLVNELEQMNATESGKRQGKLLTMSFGGHSQILQTWFEGGILGPVMFITMLVLGINAARGWVSEKNISVADPLILVSILLGGWDILMSPFAGSHRPSNAVFFGGVIVARVLLKRRNIYNLKVEKYSNRIKL